MRIIVSIVLAVVFTHSYAQINIPNFRPYTRNASFAAANQSAVKELLDSTCRRFLIVANDPHSKIHKAIQQEFKGAKEQDRLESYNYPKTLKRSHLTIQFLDWTSTHGLQGGDSAWTNEMLTALVIIPMPREEWKGESATCICFMTELNISDVDKLEGGNSCPDISFTIKRIKDLSSITEEVLFGQKPKE